jgi:hypothetical protein
MADGFHGDLLFQIAEEMRERFPSIFKDHQLGQSKFAPCAVSVVVGKS